MAFQMKQEANTHPHAQNFNDSILLLYIDFCNRIFHSIDLQSYMDFSVFKFIQRIFKRFGQICHINGFHNLILN